MPWREPDYDGEFPSLGWALADWYGAWLKVPDGDRLGEPLILTDEQLAFTVRWYRIDPRTGKFAFRRGALREAKGKGKSPHLAATAIGELCGPVVFDGWDANGEPVGRPHPSSWVQMAANSEDQVGNTYSAAYAMLTDSPAVDEFGVDVGLTRIFMRGSPGKLEPVTAAAGSREGQRITFAVLDETHLWTPQNGGRKLAASLLRNLAKMNGRSLESTNAYRPGDSSVAEATHHAAEKNEPGLLYQATEAPWVDNLADKRTLKRALKVAYGDATWVDLDRLVAEVQDSATDPSDARRFYLNQIVKGDGRAVDPHRWAELVSVESVEDGATIALGFDGSISGDATALVGCTAAGHLFEVAVWERPLGVRDWRVPRREVHEAVAAAWSRWSVGLMLCDPPKWESEIDEWAERFGDERVLKFDTFSERRFGPAVSRWRTAIAEGSLTHDGTDVLTRHTLAATLKKSRVKDPEDDGRTQYVITKGLDGLKIDAAVAAVLAFEAACTMPPPDAPLLAMILGGTK